MGGSYVTVALGATRLTFLQRKFVYNVTILFH